MISRHLGSKQANTISRTLRREALRSRTPRRTPVFQKRHAKARLKYANDHLNKPAAFWNSVLWSNETKIELFGRNGTNHVWRQQNEECKPKCTIPAVEFEGHFCAIQEEMMVSRFFCLAVMLGSDNTQLLALVPGVFALGVVRGYLPVPPACPFTALSALLKGMAKEYQNAPSTQSKHSVQRCCMSLLQGVDKAVQSVVQQTPPPSHLPLLLQALADAVLHAPALLHVKSRGASSPLASWLTSAVLTKASYKLDTALPLHFTRALQPALPSFVLGLCTLPLQQDPFLARLARSVLTNFMHCYPSSPLHPCLVMVCGVVGAEPVALERVRTLMLTVLNTEFFSKKWTTGHHRVHIALQVLQAMLLAVDSSCSTSAVLEGQASLEADWNGVQWCAEAITSLLPPLLRLLLASEDRHTNRCVTELLRTMFDLAKRRGVPDLSRLVSCVEELVRSQLSWQSSKVFTVLMGLCVLHRPLVAASLPSVLQVLTATELKRGTGVDTQLR
ncbi:MMS22-like C-terminal [Trinorchestia longiramus]|nr:MMS22-like C-terminal [Trinorchestia longiramus]